jgi:hypothetical protein
MAHFLCVVTRVRDQTVLMRDWVPHYLAEGASLLLVLEDSSSTQPLRSTVLQPLGLDSDPRVVVQSAAISMHLEGQAVALENAVYAMRDKCTWVVSVDADEFLTTRREPEKPVAQVLRESFEHADFITVPWIMFGIDATMPAWQEPQSIVAENVWRWDHDAHHGGENDTALELSRSKEFFRGKGRDRYDSIEGKPVFRAKVLPAQTAECHERNPKEGHCAMHDLHDMHSLQTSASRHVDGVAARPWAQGAGGPFNQRNFHGLHEPQIAEALLAINHYRLTSIAAVRRKCEACTIHIHSIA